ncbi:MAG: HipA domain-containing protein [Gammaproteobacteria bacterium]|nr:HipA domain-containing protein [Gammaproteobacteria bacterium]
MQNNKLSVRLFGQPIGILELDNKGRLHFNYLSNATMSISLSLPSSEQAFDHKHCHRFFKSLLPQNDNILNSISKILEIEPNNTFDFLRLMGQDCVGALSFHLLCSEIEDKQTSPLKGEIISDKELAHRLGYLCEIPMLVNEEGRRALLPGLQSKVAVCLIDNQIAVPSKGCFSTHILKFPARHAKDLIDNEYFCMRLASRLGLHVCAVEMRKIQKTNTLLIKRYDREICGNIVKHYHQEDFCQALGVLPSRKLEVDGGPGFVHCFSLLQKANIPAIDRNHFMRMIFFNYLIGNTQGHAKNISLLYLSPRYFQLAPFYDISSILDDASNMAMKIGDDFFMKAIKSRNWQILCTQIGYSYPAFKQLAQEMLDVLLESAKIEHKLMEEEGKETDFVDELIKFLKKNIQQVEKMLNFR